MPEKKEWKRSDTSKVDRRKPAHKSLPGLFAGASGESLHTSYGTMKCPIHQSTNHTLQECKRLKGLLTSEKEKVVEEQTVLPYVCKCCGRNRFQVENCDMQIPLYMKST